MSNKYSRAKKKLHDKNIWFKEERVTLGELIYMLRELIITYLIIMSVIIIWLYFH